MQGSVAPTSSIRWGDLDATLVLCADILLTFLILQTLLVQAIGVHLPWWWLALPTILANVLAGGYAAFKRLTALPFGPNTVFLFAFYGGAISPLLAGNSAQAAATRAGDLADLMAASLLLFGTALVLFLYLLNRWSARWSRLAMLLPLAAICWCYLVAAPLQKVAGMSYVLALPALALAAGLLRSKRTGLPWLWALGLWALLLLINPVPGAPPETPQIATLGVDALRWPQPQNWLFQAEFWLRAAPLLFALALGNAVGVLENVAAARELGDQHSLGAATATLAAGNLLCIALGSATPMTIYVGHTAYKQKSAGFAYVIAASVVFAVASPWFSLSVLQVLPTDILYGAVIFVGVRVGLLPLPHLNRRNSVAALLAVLPIVIAFLLQRAPEALGALSSLAHGGGVVAVGWSVWFFGCSTWRQRAWISATLSLLAAAGVVHGPVASLSGTLWSLAYVVATAITFLLSRRGREGMGFFDEALPRIGS